MKVSSLKRGQPPRPRVGGGSLPRLHIRRVRRNVGNEKKIYSELHFPENSLETEDEIKDCSWFQRKRLRRNPIFLALSVPKVETRETFFPISCILFWKRNPSPDSLLFLFRKSYLYGKCKETDNCDNLGEMSLFDFRETLLSFHLFAPISYFRHFFQISSA